MTDSGRRPNARRTSRDTTTNAGALPHAEAIESLIREGRHAEAKFRHAQQVDAEFGRAGEGDAINLSALLAAKEELDFGGADAGGVDNEQSY